MRIAVRPTEEMRDSREENEVPTCCQEEIRHVHDQYT